MLYKVFYFIVGDESSQGALLEDYSDDDDDLPEDDHIGIAMAKIFPKGERWVDLNNYATWLKCTNIKINFNWIPSWDNDIMYFASLAQRSPHPNQKTIPIPDKSAAEVRWVYVHVVFCNIIDGHGSGCECVKWKI